MKLINSQNVYSFILDEGEWYGPQVQQSALIDRCLHGAAESGCRYASIMVDPDAVMSISPNPKRHKVWGHTFPADAEKELRLALVNAHADAAARGMAAKEIAGVIRAYWDAKFS